MPLFERSAENPVLGPDPQNPWAAGAAFNGSVVDADGQVHVVYRAESHPQRIADAELALSTIGHAVRSPAGAFTDHEQLLRPEFEWEQYGCEDPRITRFEGRYYVLYTALSKYPFEADGIRLAVAVSDDLKHWEKHPVTPFNAKAGALFPERVGGKIAMVLTADTDRPPAKIAIAMMDDISQLWSPDFWQDWYADIEEHRLHLVRTPVDHVEVGAAPVLTRDGWLLLYSYIRDYFHGDERSFGIEAVLLDRDEPRRIVGRTSHALLAPETAYELAGRVPDVVFPSGAHVADGRLDLYYGASDTTCCRASCDLDALLAEIRRDGLTMQRFDGNPILAPRPGMAWEAKGTFNAGAIRVGGRVHLLYRAVSDGDVSTLGYASSEDGFHFDVRSDAPVYVPRAPFERPARDGVGSGCEDPRLTRIGDRVHMYYTAYDGVDEPRVAHTSIAVDDLVANDWKWDPPRLVSPAGLMDKDAALFPRTIGGRYWALHRLGNSIWIDARPELSFSETDPLGGQVLLDSTQAGGSRIGIAGPPTETAQGWLLLYHAVSTRSDHHYHLKAALLDLDDPTRIVADMPYAFLEPEQDYEREGPVPNVVFSCGHAVVDDRLLVYYGGADLVTAVASAPMAPFVARVAQDGARTTRAEPG